MLTTASCSAPARAGVVDADLDRGMRVALALPLGGAELESTAVLAQPSSWERLTGRRSRRLDGRRWAASSRACAGSLDARGRGIVTRRRSIQLARCPWRVSERHLTEDGLGTTLLSSKRSCGARVCVTHLARDAPSRLGCRAARFSTALFHRSSRSSAGPRPQAAPPRRAKHLQQQREQQRQVRARGTAHHYYCLAVVMAEALSCGGPPRAACTAAGSEQPSPAAAAPAPGARLL